MSVRLQFNSTDTLSITLSRELSFGGLLRCCIALVFFGIFGPGFLALGTSRLGLSCDRKSAVTCHIEESWLFGLILRRDTAHGVTGVNIKTRHGTSQRPGGAILSPLASGLVLETTNGFVPLTILSANHGDDQKFKIRKQINVFLKHAGTPSVTVAEATYSVPFILGSTPFTLIWLWALLGTLAGFFFPKKIFLNRAGEMRGRASSWRPFARQRRLHGCDIKDVGMTKRFGQPGIRLELHSGETIVFASSSASPPGELQAVVDSIRKFLGLAPGTAKDRHTL